MGLVMLAIQDWLGFGYHDLDLRFPFAAFSLCFGLHRVVLILDFWIRDAGFGLVSGGFRWVLLISILR